MPTVQEILKASGLTDEQITALDAKVVDGLTKVVSSADETLSKAELAARAQRETYDKEIAPALDNWANEKASYDAKIAAYDAALKSAKEGGFKVPEILDAKTEANRDPNSGKFVANANEVPGSPKIIENLRNEVGNAFSFAADTQWKYRTLFNKEMPDSPTDLIKEAQANRMSASAWAAKKYDFAGREAAIKAEQEKATRDAIVKETEDRVNKSWAEKVGSNPMVRQAEASKFSVLEKAVKSGERPDPLKMTREQRHVATGNIIRKEIAETVQ